MIVKLLASGLVLGGGWFMLQAPRGLSQTLGSSENSVHLGSPTAPTPPLTHYRTGKNIGDCSREIVEGSLMDILESFKRDCRDQGLTVEDSKWSEERMIAWSKTQHGENIGLMAVKINPTHVAVYHFKEEAPATPPNLSSPSSPFAQIPEPPWSKEICAQNTNRGEMQIKIFQCDGGGAEIVNFYREKFASLGWEELQDRNKSAPLDELLSFRLGETLCFVQVDHGSAQSLVTLILDHLQ